MSRQGGYKSGPERSRSIVMPSWRSRPPRLMLTRAASASAPGRNPWRASSFVIAACSSSRTVTGSFIARCSAARACATAGPCRAAIGRRRRAAPARRLPFALLVHAPQRHAGYLDRRTSVRDPGPLNAAAPGAAVASVPGFGLVVHPPPVSAAITRWAHRMRPCCRSCASAHRDSRSRDWLKGAARPSSTDTRFATTCTWGVVPSRCATSTA